METIKATSEVCINMQDAADIIKASVQALLNNPGLASKLPAIMLRGAPGVGKSTLVQSIAKELGIDFIDVRLAQLERVDFCGLPSVTEHITEWNVPSFWPRDPKSRGILLLDEISSAPPDVQVAAYQLVLDRKISNSNYSLPDGWYVIAAGNRVSDRAVVKTMSSALANRFMHFNINASAPEWIKWAIGAGIHPSVTGFIDFRPNLLFKMDGQNLEQGWPSPRSWERVSNIIQLLGTNEEALRKAVAGLVGPGPGLEFMEFHRTAKKFESVIAMLTDPKVPVEIPTKTDEKAAFTAAVAYNIWSGNTDEDDKVRVEGLYRIINKLSPDFAILLMKNVMLGNPRVSKMQAIQKVMTSPSYKKFKDSHAAAFAEQHTLEI